MTAYEAVTQIPVGILGILIGLAPVLSWLALAAGLIGLELVIEVAGPPRKGIARPAIDTDVLDLLMPLLLIAGGLYGLLVL